MIEGSKLLVSNQRNSSDIQILFRVKKSFFFRKIGPKSEQRAVAEAIIAFSVAEIAFEECCSWNFSSNCTVYCGPWQITDVEIRRTGSASERWLGGGRKRGRFWSGEISVPGNNSKGKKLVDNLLGLSTFHSATGNKEESAKFLHCNPDSLLSC